MILDISNQPHKNLDKVIQDLADYAFFFLDTDGQVLTWNQGAQNIQGYSPGEIIGKKFHCLHTTEDLFNKKPEKLLASAAKNGKTHDEGWRMRKNGTSFWCSATIAALSDETGELTGFVMLAHDLTDRKLAETAAMLEARNKEMEQFNYIASHDLQEPLRTVAIYAQLLEEDYGEELDDTARRYMQSIRTANDRMRILVRSLLEYAKIGEGETRTFTDCNLLVKNVLDDLFGLVEKTNSKVFIGELPSLYCYANELRLVFQNLITNAIKFQRKDIAPIIEIDCKKHNQTFVFSVSDNGIGIQQKYFDKIFQVFKRLNRATEFDGHGIGLANCKKILELHGGKIWVESELGKGSTFKFSLDNFHQ